MLNVAILQKKINLNIKMGHGLDYGSTKISRKIKEVCEFNIGHFIMGESIFFGLKHVIKKFKKIKKINGHKCLTKKKRIYNINYIISFFALTVQQNYLFQGNHAHLIHSLKNINLMDLNND